MKSGFPPLKTNLALDWTQTHFPVLVRSLKTVKPVSPVFITGDNKERVRYIYLYINLYINFKYVCLV